MFSRESSGKFPPQCGTVLSPLVSHGDARYTTSSSLTDFSCRCSWTVTDVCHNVTWFPMFRSSAPPYGNATGNVDREILNEKTHIKPTPRVFKPVILQHCRMQCSPMSLLPNRQMSFTSQSEDGMRKQLTTLTNKHSPTSFWQTWQDRRCLVAFPKTNTFPCENSGKWFGHTAKSTPAACGVEKTASRNKCPFCHVTCSNKGQLKGHIRSHTGEKPFQCAQTGCGRAFARKEELTRHLRIHSGARPYACGLCARRFGRKDHLNKHINTHRKDKHKAAYACVKGDCKTSGPAR